MNVTGGVLSLKVTVYIVPEGFVDVPEIGKVSESPEQIVVLPGLPRPTAGLLPTNMWYWPVSTQPFDDVTMKNMS